MINGKSLMLKFPSSVRLWITAGVLVGAFVLLHSVSHGETIVPHQPLHELPLTLGNWTGKEQPLEARIVQVVGVSDYTNRIYSSQQAGLAQVYIGYYSNQRTGDTIHSPKNCLPGAGWDPVQSDYATISIPGGRQIVVNEYVIQQGLDKMLVFYWYQDRGRVIASEYSAKFWMVADAISRNRTDGALVRLITPLHDDEVDARARLVSFTQILFPHLESVIPN
jgi:EpsI family protein